MQGCTARSAGWAGGGRPAKQEEAATDGTDRLRYPVGDDARGFLKARQTLDDADYTAFMRGCFADGGPV